MKEVNKNVYQFIIAFRLLCKQMKFCAKVYIHNIARNATVFDALIIVVACN